MKWLTWILFISNLGVAGFFLAADFWRGTPSDTHAPLNVDRLSLRSSSQHAGTSLGLPPATSSSALCVDWRGLDQTDFSRVREQLKNMAGARVMSFTEMPVNIYHWVIFPPLPSHAAALTKLAELRTLGIQDISPIPDGRWASGLSLGLFENVEAARRRTRELEEKGVHGTLIETQPKPGTEYYFMIRSDDADALKSLNDAKTAFPNSVLSRVACNRGAGQ